MPICHPYIFFSEVSVEIFCPFLSSCFLIVEFFILDTSYLLDMCFTNIFSKPVAFFILLTAPLTEKKF